jgi:hypothetical protein
VFSSVEGFGTELWEFASIFFLPTEFRVIFSSAEGFRTEFRDFLFRGTAGIPSEITICSVYSIFRGIIFLSEIPNRTPDRGGRRGPLTEEGFLTKEDLLTKQNLLTEEGLLIKEGLLTEGAS